MKEQFIRKRFNVKSRDLLKHIVPIVEKYAMKGMDLSLRQLYYLLVGAGHLPKGKTGKERLRIYKNLGNLISDARYAGVIDWNAIQDRERTPNIPQPNDSIPEIISSIKHMFKVDLWARQNVYVEVFCEKRSLDGVLMPLCWELDVPFSSNKGYSSTSAYYDASKRFLEAAEAGKELHLIYLGDHDASGIDMTRDTDDRFTLFIESATTGQLFNDVPKLFEELAMIDPRPLEVHRVALNMDQAQQMHLIPAFGDDKDSRMGGYYHRFGTKEIYELAAVEPETMVSIVREAVENLVDKATWAEDKAREEKGRAELQRFADTYDKNPEILDADLVEELEQTKEALAVCEAREREIIYLPPAKKIKPKKSKKEKRTDYEI